MRSSKRLLRTYTTVASLSAYTGYTAALDVAEGVPAVNKTAADWMEVDFSAWSHENDFFEAFRAAIQGGNVVEFEYYNAHGDKSLRRVEPVKALFKSRAWYLKGFCLSAESMRIFKVSRMKSFRITEETFAQREIHSLLDDSGSNKPGAEVNMKFRIEPEMAYRVFDDFHESMVRKQPDGGFIAEVYWPEDSWLYGLILSYGRHIEVIEPKRLRGVIKNEAQKISEKYP